MVIPWLLGRYVRKAQQNFQESQHEAQGPQYREGEVHISKPKDSNGSSKDKDGGDYVDYEEVKD
jgi:hypothetical protein